MSNSEPTHPLVSIVVPVYNAERYLKQSVDSIIDQDFQDFEVICVNDGSTDSSLEMLHAYEECDARIRVVSQANGGLSAARNTGIEHSRGKYIAFLDSDDWLTPDMLSTVVAIAEENNSEIVIFDYWLYDDPTGELGTYRDQEIYASLNGRTFSFAEAPEMAQFIGVWDRLFLRSFIEEHGFRYPVGRIYEDVTFCVESELAASRISLCSKHLYYYRRGVEGSITNDEDKNKNHKLDFLYVQDYAQKCFRDYEVSEEVWKYYAQYFVEYALMHQRQTRPYSFFKEFFGSIRVMANPVLLSYGQRSASPELYLYRMLLRANLPLLSYIFLKGMNRIKYYGRRIYWGVRGIGTSDKKKDENE